MHPSSDKLSAMQENERCGQGQIMLRFGWISAGDEIPMGQAFSSSYVVELHFFKLVFVVSENVREPDATRHLSN